MKLNLNPEKVIRDKSLKKKRKPKPKVETSPAPERKKRKRFWQKGKK